MKLKNQAIISKFVNNECFLLYYEETEMRNLKSVTNIFSCLQTLF